MQCTRHAVDGVHARRYVQQTRRRRRVSSRVPWKHWTGTERSKLLLADRSEQLVRGQEGLVRVRMGLREGGGARGLRRLRHQVRCDESTGTRSLRTRGNDQGGDVHTPSVSVTQTAGGRYVKKMPIPLSLGLLALSAAKRMHTTLPVERPTLLKRILRLNKAK